MCTWSVFVECPGPGLSAGKSGGPGRAPPIFLPFTSACLIASTESLCVGRMRMVLCQFRRQILPGIPTRSAEGACVGCGCRLLVRRGSREGQMISPSPRGPGSAEVLEPNLRHEPGLILARTDSQHGREPPPSLHRPAETSWYRCRGDSQRHVWDLGCV